MSLRTLSRDFAFYGALDFLQRSLTIILVPIYTRVLSQSSYGDLDLILTVFGILTVLVDLQFVAGFSRLYLEHRKTGDGAQFAGTTLLTRVAVGTLVAALFLACGYAGLLEVKFIPSFLGHRLAWTLIVIGVPVSFVFDILLLQAQLLRFKRWFFAGAAGNTFLSTVLSVVLTVFIPWGIVGIVLAQLIGKVVASVVLFVGLRREIAFRCVRTLLHELSAYSLPIVPGRWVSHSSAYVSRFFVYGALGASEDAILAITAKLAAVVGIFCLAFRTAWQPLAMAYIGEENAEAFYVRSLRVFMSGGLFTVYALTILCKPVLAILAPRSYAVAEYYVPIFLIASVIGELDVNLQIGNQISKKTYWISMASVLAFVMNILVLFFFTKTLGIYAAGIGLLVSFLAKILITYSSAQRNYKIEYDRMSMFTFFAGIFALLLLAAARGAHVINEPLFFTAASLLGLTFPLWILGPERNILLQVARDRFRRFRTA